MSYQKGMISTSELCPRNTANNQKNKPFACECDDQDSTLAPRYHESDSAFEIADFKKNTKKYFHQKYECPSNLKDDSLDMVGGVLSPYSDRPCECSIKSSGKSYNFQATAFRQCPTVARNEICKPPVLNVCDSCMVKACLEEPASKPPKGKKSKQKKAPVPEESCSDELLTKPSKKKKSKQKKDTISKDSSLIAVDGVCICKSDISNTSSLPALQRSASQRSVKSSDRPYEVCCTHSSSSSCCFPRPPKKDCCQPDSLEECSCCAISRHESINCSHFINTVYRSNVQIKNGDLYRLESVDRMLKDKDYMKLFSDDEKKKLLLLRKVIELSEPAVRVSKSKKRFGVRNLFKIFPVLDNDGMNPLQAERVCKELDEYEDIEIYETESNLNLTKSSALLELECLLNKYIPKN